MLSTSKSTIRSIVRAKIRSFPIEVVEKHSEAAARVLFDTDEWRRATCVSLYLPLPKGEVQTWEILFRSLQDKKKTFLPRVVGRNPWDMKLLQVFDLMDLSTFETSKWGILEPPLYLCNSSTSTADATGDKDITLSKHLVERPSIQDQGVLEEHLIIVPGVAFDKQGSRVGQGKGYYDYFLSTFTSQRLLSDATPPVVFGVAFDEQVLDSDIVPMDSNDFYLDGLVTPSGVHRAAQKPIQLQQTI